MKRKLIIIAFLFAALITYAQQKVEGIPSEKKIRTYVTDLSGTLNSSEISSLEQKLRRFEDSTSNQLVVYIVKSLDGNSLEEMSYDIAEKNGIGQKSKNNGVLLFIAMEDRKLRIEVGYGLEGALPDALAGQIIRNEITPYFKQKKYYEGINAGVDAIIQATKGEYKADKKKTGNDGETAVCCGFPIAFFVIIIIIFFFIGMPILSRIFGWGRRGGGPWFTGGSSGWSSGSSGGFSGGGFSGGGGSFGGGGASGSW